MYIQNFDNVMKRENLKGALQDTLEHFTNNRNDLLIKRGIYFIQH